MNPTYIKANPIGILFEPSWTRQNPTNNVELHWNKILSEWALLESIEPYSNEVEPYLKPREHYLNQSEPY